MCPTQPTGTIVVTSMCVAPRPPYIAIQVPCTCIGSLPNYFWESQNLPWLPTYLWLLLTTPSCGCLSHFLQDLLNFQLSFTSRLKDREISIFL